MWDMIVKEAIFRLRAKREGRRFRLDWKIMYSTTAEIDLEEQELRIYHYNTPIARIQFERDLLILSSGGHYSPTTKRRLNWLLWPMNYYVFQRSWVWYLELPGGYIAPWTDEVPLPAEKIPSYSALKAEVAMTAEKLLRGA